MPATGEQAVEDQTQEAQQEVSADEQALEKDKATLKVQDGESVEIEEIETLEQENA